MVASPSFARASSGQRSLKQKSFDVDLVSAAMMNNGQVLKAGDYTMKITENTPTPEVTFYQDGTLIAQSQAKAETQPSKNEKTAIHLKAKGDTQVITAIDPSGWSEKLVFGNSSVQTGS